MSSIMGKDASVVAKPNDTTPQIFTIWHLRTGVFEICVAQSVWQASHLEMCKALWKEVNSSCGIQLHDLFAIHVSPDIKGSYH